MAENERIAELETQVAELKKVVNPSRFMSSRLSPDAWDAEIAKREWLPNGDMNVADNLHQLRVDWAKAWEKVASLTEQVTSLTAKLASATSAVAALTTRVATLEAKPATTTTTTTTTDGLRQLGGELGYGMTLKDKRYPSSPQHVLFTGGYDGGLRMIFNHIEDYLGGSWLTHSVASLPQLRIDFEQDGVMSFNYQKRKDKAAGAYDDLGGKDIAFRPGGQTTEGGQKTEFAMIYSGLLGRGLELGVSPTIPNVHVARIRMTEDGVLLYVGGQMRLVRMRSDGTLYV